MRSLYICYFGLREPLVQSQVLPYLRELVAAGVKMWLLTFEPERRKRWDAASIREWRERLRADGIEWEMTAYHKRPSLPATLFDILAGSVRATRIVKRHGIGILHARSDVPAAIGAVVKKLTGAKLIFDIRGLLADEYAESANWRRDGVLYRLTKRVERILIRSADAFVVLTQRVERELFANETRPLAVIPCCVELSRFSVSAAERERIRESLGVRDRNVIVYAGSLGTGYLPPEMAAFLSVAKAIDERVFALILTQSDPEILTRHLDDLGFTRNDYRALYVQPEALPSYLAAADVALSMILPSYSRIAASPTKFAEYLAAGLPVVSTRGIGDLDRLIAEEEVGVLLDGLDEDSYRKAFEMIQRLSNDVDLKRRCAAVASREYDLHAIGGARYARLYRSLS